MNRIVTSVILVSLVLTFASCGEFTGLKDDDADIGNTEKFEVFLEDDDLYKLYSSITTDQYTPCSVDYESWRGEAEIKVRGYTSRMHDKKSFQLKAGGKKYVLERGRDDGGVYNRIAMRAYQLAGLPACDTRSIGLFLNGEYLGCYNLIFYYDEDEIGGELYKCHFLEYDDMSLNHPLRSLCEKKFPDDDDYSNLENLISALTTFDDDAWRNFVLENVDIKRAAAYRAVHDFMMVVDTHSTNYYLGYDGKFYFLPWDNEQCIRFNFSSYEIRGDNQLMRRLSDVKEFRDSYNSKMAELFINEGILEKLRSEAMAMFDEAEGAMVHDPTCSLDEFLEKKNRAKHFLSKTGRKASLKNPVL